MLVAIPGAPARVRIVIVALVPLVIVPSKQVTVPPASEHVPCVVITGERKVTFGGKGSVTVTVVAVAGPVFFTVRV